MLKIKKLKVKANEKFVLNGIDFELGEGQVQAILGPNGSGKSTLVQVIAGNPHYEIVEGELIYKGKNINKLEMEERVASGIVVTSQNPPSIKGVKLGSFLDKISKVEIDRELGKSLLHRDINANFSGGEKKISELLQVMSLNPKLLILDEIAAGLDAKNLEKITEIIRENFIKKGVSVLIITHLGKILDELKPDITSVMRKGRITCRTRDYKCLLDIIQKDGYQKCENCPLLAD